MTTPYKTLQSCTQGQHNFILCLILTPSIDIYAQLTMFELEQHAVGSKLVVNDTHVTSLFAQFPVTMPKAMKAKKAAAAPKAMKAKK